MDSYEQLIEKERQAIAVLHRKIAEREERIRLIETLRQPDKFDQLLETEIAQAANVSAPPPQATPATVKNLKTEQAWPFPIGRDDPKVDLAVTATAPTKRFDGRSIAVLDFLGDDLKSLPDVTKFLFDKEMISQPEQARRIIFRLKNELGAIETPRRGFYRRKPEVAIDRGQSTENDDEL